MLSNLVSRDLSTNTGSNLRVVAEASGVCPWTAGTTRLREAISAKETVEVLDEDKWRLSMLDKLLSSKQSMNYLGEEEEVSRLSDLINSLCIN